MFAFDIEKLNQKRLYIPTVVRNTITTFRQN